MVRIGILICSFVISLHSIGKEIRVLSWNIFQLPTSAKNVLQGPRIEPIAEAILEDDYDFVFLQEVFYKRSYKKLKKKLKERYPYSTGKPKRSLFTLANSGLVIFSKYPLDQIKFKRFKGMKHADKLSSKGFLIARAKIKEGVYVNVATTHLQAKKSKAKYIKARKKNILQIEKQFLKNSKYSENPLILGGDFNIRQDIPNDEYVFLEKTFSKYGGRTNREPSSERKFTSDSTSNGLIQFLFPEKKKQKRIDYFFAFDKKERLHYDDYQIHDFKGKIEFYNFVHIKSLSDHFPIVGVFEITE